MLIKFSNNFLHLMTCIHDVELSSLDIFNSFFVKSAFLGKESNLIIWKELSGLLSYQFWSYVVSVILFNTFIYVMWLIFKQFLTDWCKSYFNRTSWLVGRGFVKASRFIAYIIFYNWRTYFPQCMVRIFLYTIM